MQKNQKKLDSDLAFKFREQIYSLVIPLLADGIASQLKLRNPTKKELEETYQISMRVLFRLLFIAYAEEKDLLPHKSNKLYQENSLKTIAENLLDLWNSKHEFGPEFSWWDKFQSILRAFKDGNTDWDIPAYSGGLFSIDQSDSKILTTLEEIKLPDYYFGPILQNLLLVKNSEIGKSLVDFSKLDFEEFGTIYQGLLESELSVAETDLLQEKKGKYKGTYRECLEHEDLEIVKGQVYLLNRSDARKSTGSYYTNNFAVEHLLEKSLEKAIDEHLKLLDSFDDNKAGENFFDFKVADIAMGSGNFLLAAVDRIGSRFSIYLSKRNLPLVSKELDHLRKSANESLDKAVSSYPKISDNILLRRQIARRCIYGADNNEIAVQLARIALWIHTFVPGLPLSLLERNLVHGDSIVGVANLSEFEDKLKKDGGENFFSINIQDYIVSIKEKLLKTLTSSDATQAELNDAKSVWINSEVTVNSAKALCDILVAARIENKKMPLNFMYGKEEKYSILDSKEYEHALSVIGNINPIHFPVVFPEVFLRKKSGFDVILGNPPWDKIRVEEHEFWSRFAPGLRGISQREREQHINNFQESYIDLTKKLESEVTKTSRLRKIIMSGPFPGMGTGDPDLYKAFCWRFWFLVAQEGGHIGVVLPRSVFSVKGSQEFRFSIFKQAKSVDITFIINNRSWFFEDVHAQYTVGLVSIERKSSKKLGSLVYLEGPYNSMSAYESRQKNSGTSFKGEEVGTWNDSASLPLLTFPADKSIDVFKQLRKSPRLYRSKDKNWQTRPLAELHGVIDKHMFDLKSKTCPEGFWPVYKGASFNLWQPDTGEYYFWANPEVITPFLQKKRLRGNSLSSSLFHECDSNWCRNPDTLPCRFPRIAFRDISRGTDTRTVRCALIPPNVFLNHKAPYFVFQNQSIVDTIYLLGILSSFSLDWYARRFVETNLTFSTITHFPVPRPEKNNPLRLRLIELAGRLACPDKRFSDWAKAIGVNCGKIEKDEKQDLINELDAVVANLYGLSRKQLIHIFETFHVGSDYHEKLEATLKYYQK